MDEQGKGRIYGYDPVGCVEELNQCSGGAGVTLMQSLLDNQVKNFIESAAMFCFSFVLYVRRTAFSNQLPCLFESEGCVQFFFILTQKYVKVYQKSCPWEKESQKCNKVMPNCPIIHGLLSLSTNYTKRSP